MISILHLHKGDAAKGDTLHCKTFLCARRFYTARHFFYANCYYWVIQCVMLESPYASDFFAIFFFQVRQLNATIADKKSALAPVIKELRPMRQKCQVMIVINIGFLPTLSIHGTDYFALSSCSETIVRQLMTLYHITLSSCN